MLINRRLFTLVLGLVLCVSTLMAQEVVSLRGTVQDGKSFEHLPYASLLLKGTDAKEHISISEPDGSYLFKAIKPGPYTLTVYYTGYEPRAFKVMLSGNRQFDVSLLTNNQLQEVVITATESNKMVTGSKIGRDAMEHLQPSSIADLMELLPGGVSKDPDMGSVNTITMRETGTISADGIKGGVSDDYSITSLGTQFMVDGVPINTDANLQAIPLKDNSVGSSMSVVNKGVDMRTISTDDIESVEVMRGIPSAEYGNLTTGVINIKKIRKATPLNARFKVDGYSKLVAVGKGFSLSDKESMILNADLGYMDARPDPRNNLINYKRLNASLRLTWDIERDGWALRYTPALDFSGSFDDAKEDPELNYAGIDTYVSSYNRTAMTNNLRWTLPEVKWFHGVDLNTSVNISSDLLERHKLVSPQRYMIVPSTSGEGVHDAQLLFAEYESDYRIEGLPFNAFVKLKSQFEFKGDAITNRIKAGADWSFVKNYGAGEVYDPTRPLSAGGWNSRPRAYYDIPALQNLGFYAEDMFTATMGRHKLELMAGVRTIALIGLDERYAISGKTFVDPRVNGLWHFPGIELGKDELEISFGGGIGWTTKMPTLDHLFPTDYYKDIAELGYYSPSHPADYSRFLVRSYVIDRTNYDIQPARNKKWEVRLDMQYRQNRFSINYFKETMNSGFRYMSHYIPYAYRLYDATGIIDTELTAPPKLEGIPYEVRQTLGGHSQAENGSRLDKEGVEFQFQSERIKAIRTSINLNGAWFRSTYSNSMRIARTVSGVVNDQAISDLYVGLYDWNDGHVYQQFNTNLLFDTQVPEWGMIFSTSVQTMWFTTKQSLYREGVPDAYISALDGMEHPYDAAAQQDAILQHLVIKMNPAMFDEYRVPMALYVNLKATKRIGKHLRLAFFVNKLLDYTPDFTSNNVIIRRNVDPYFGVELNISL